jgi:hypothetical protein
MPRYSFGVETSLVREKKPRAKVPSLILEICAALPLVAIRTRDIFA